MSSRTLRRLMKEQEQQKEAEQGEKNDDSSESEPRTSKMINVFDMLTNADDENLDSGNAPGELDDENDENDEDETKPVDVNSFSSKGKGKRRKKPKSKNKSKTQPSKNDHSPSHAQPTGKTNQLDEIDLALKSLSTKTQDGSYAISNVKTNDQELQTWQLLGVDSKQLNALNEMKRLFGNVVLEGDSDGAVAPGHGRRRARGPQQLDLGGALAGRNSPASKGQGLAGLALRRNVFMMGKEEWPKATSGGLGMEVVEKLNVGTNQYRFVHNTAYQDVQRQFEACVASMEPQRMIQMLQLNPYHISTLLQVSEIAKQQGDHSVSGDLLERALFSFGRSVHSSFTTALSEGKARLDFQRPENREFWLAAWRYISNLCQRGTWRTAYEWAKLLLSLSPENDPYRVSLILDQLALRGGQGDHLLRLKKCHFFQEKWRNYPNIHISSALAEYKAKRAAECRLLLAKAVKKYPWIFARLFHELNIEPIPKSIWGKNPRSEREKLECEIYVLGAKDLWSNPDATSFLVEVTGSVTVDDLPPVRNADITIDEARHVVLTGTPALISLIPRAFTTTSYSSSDPLPPAENKISYVIAPITDRDIHTQDFDEHFHFDGPPGLPPDLDPQDGTPRSAEQQDEDVQELRGLQSFFSRLIPWIAPSLIDETTDHAATDQGVTDQGVTDQAATDQAATDQAATDQAATDQVATDQEATESPLRTPQQQIFDFVALGAGHPQEVLAARGMRLIELLRRTLGRDPQPGELLPETITPPTANQRNSSTSSSTSSSFPLSRTPPPQQQTPSLIPEPYDDDRNQRWLAGQGMLRLRDFAASHGTDEAAWTAADPDLANEGRQLVTEYARRLLRLNSQQTRRFLVDYVLRQGSSAEVRELVLRYVALLGG